MSTVAAFCCDPHWFQIEVGGHTRKPIVRDGAQARMQLRNDLPPPFKNVCGEEKPLAELSERRKSRLREEKRKLKKQPPPAGWSPSNN